MVTCCRKAERAGWGCTDWRGGGSRAGSGWSSRCSPSWSPAASLAELRPLSLSLCPPPPPPPQDHPPDPPVSLLRSRIKCFEWKILGSFSCVDLARSSLPLLHFLPVKQWRWELVRTVLGPAFGWYYCSKLCLIFKVNLFVIVTVRGRRGRFHWSVSAAAEADWLTGLAGRRLIVAQKTSWLTRKIKRVAAPPTNGKPPPACGLCTSGSSKPQIDLTLN